MVQSRTARKSSCPTGEPEWLVFVPRKDVLARSQRSSPERMTGLNRIGLIEMSVGSVYLGLVV